MTVEELRESLMMSPKNGYVTLSGEERQEMNDGLGLTALLLWLRQA